MTKPNVIKELDLARKSDQVLAALRANAEDRNQPDAGWLMVYLDNAKPNNMSQKTFRSCLSVLSHSGVYKVMDGWAWGSVKMK